MNQNEVVELLEGLRKEFERDKVFFPQLAEKHEKALTEAIRAVELVPELVEALEMSQTLLERHYHHSGIIETNEKLLKKAKGLIG